MSSQPREVTESHIQLLKCTLEVENARAYWRHHPLHEAVVPETAYSECWFGARSLERVKLLLSNFRARFDAFPQALAVLHAWNDMKPDIRRLICHWHLQLSDPLYRDFTGSYLPERRRSQRQTITRDLAVKWLSDHGPERWTLATRTGYASKLLTASYQAGLLASRRDPCPLSVPPVPDHALAYLLHLLRHVSFAGSLASNPYLQSLDLAEGTLDNRVRQLGNVKLFRQAGAVSFEWTHASLHDWATDHLALPLPKQETAP